jgi:hypothetical protein
MMRIIEAGLAAVIYTTPRHTPERPRWRVGFPFAGPMTAAARGSNSDACPSPRGLGPLSWDRQRQWSRNELC